MRARDRLEGLAPKDRLEGLDRQAKDKLLALLLAERDSRPRRA